MFGNSESSALLCL